ncbi:hypothetical protein [Calothrix sp. UHCC 0171]|uniref:hypothetical protein n=1 Tax=Calothrix sp. UHCC 0171 TaxID=3110245 RepID=UPI002B1FD4DB|nr:hypothetical protein [Calothrix sp. UHCC 0171]MEA5574057.1 hypothetical protein [Calothrix sp. UHCC 0171]
MASTNSKKIERLSVMVPRDCKSDIDYIMSATGIKSNGELFKLMLTRYREDFILAYNQFFTPTTSQEQPADTPTPLPSNNQPASKPLTSAMDF